MLVDYLRIFRNVYLQSFARPERVGHAFLCFCLVAYCSVLTAGQQQNSPVALETDNSSAFVHQYFSINSVADVIAAYKKANRPGPVFIPHPLRTHPNPSMPSRNSTYPAQFLIDLSENASLVVVAQAGISKTLLMDDGSFLYSNFLFTVDHVLLDRENKVVSGDDIYVTRIGVTLRLQGMVVNAVDPEFQPFEPGGKYVLFLRRVPGTNFFHATAPGSFALGSRQSNKADGEARRLDSHPLEELSTDSGTNTALIQEVVNAITAAEEERINLHGPHRARIAAEGAACAQLQGITAFWSVHNALFHRQSEITLDNIKPSLIAIAEGTPQLDVKVFRSCLDDQMSLGIVLRDADLASANQVTATPTLFVNGHRLQGIRDSAQLREVIAEALQDQASHPNKAANDSAEIDRTTK